MSKSRCKNCGETYEEKWATDFYGFDHFIGCPVCGDVDRWEVYKCARCGKYFRDDELNESDLCDDCAEEMLDPVAKMEPDEDDGKVKKYLVVCVEDREMKLPRIEKVVDGENRNEVMRKAEKEYPNYKDIQVYDWLY